MMESKQRFLTALKRSMPDRLPATTHHVMQYFLEHTMDGISVQEFFAYFGLDPIHWIVARRADGSKGEYFDLDPKRPDAMETFTPPSLGGDVDLSEAKKRIGHRVCLIEGFDQFHYFKGNTQEETRSAVRKCFEEAGEGGGYILAPSDHFFEADMELLNAYADEAKKCVY